jgi:type IX secretion system PorP/SprF family membrane protein
MIKYLLKIILGILLLASPVFLKSLKAQYQTTSQSVVNQEFFNPAYNSFKSGASISLFNRWQWAKMDNSPRTYALNAYCPLLESALGIGTTVLSESIGLRDITTMYATLSHNVKLNSKSFLSLGYGIGFESICYNKDEMVGNSGVDFSAVSGLNTLSPAANIGLMYLTSSFFVGISSNMVFRKTDFTSTLVPGFDFMTGIASRISNNIIFKPAIVVKYYQERRIGTDPLYNKKKNAQTLIELSANFKLGDLLWVGTSHRFNQAQSILVEVPLFEKLKLGLNYEIGIGSGLNQLNSQSIRLVWDFGAKKKYLRSYKRRNIPNYSPIIYYP